MIGVLMILNQLSKSLRLLLQVNQGMGKETELAVEVQHSILNLEHLLQENLDNAYVLGRLGIMHAFAGNKVEAITAGKQAIELTQVDKDALSGPTHYLRLGEIYSIIGEVDLAIDQLEYLLSFISGVTAWTIKLNPYYAPLRNHPRYLRLIRPTPPA